MKKNLIKLFEQTTIQPYVEEKQEDEIQHDSKVKIDTGLHLNNKAKKLAQDFLDYVAEKFNLEDYPTVHLLAQRHKGMTYGVFNPNTDEIMVYAKDRGLADILRTAAHELTHYWQKKEDRIQKNLRGRDHGLESEANTQAGDLIYMFGLEHPDVYELGIKTDVIEVPKD